MLIVKQFNDLPDFGYTSFFIEAYNIFIPRCLIIEIKRWVLVNSMRTEYDVLRKGR